MEDDVVAIVDCSYLSNELSKFFIGVGPICIDGIATIAGLEKHLGLVVRCLLVTGGGSWLSGQVKSCSGYHQYGSDNYLLGHSSLIAYHVRLDCRTAVLRMLRTRPSLRA